MHVILSLHSRGWDVASSSNKQFPSNHPFHLAHLYSCKPALSGGIDYILGRDRVVSAHHHLVCELHPLAVTMTSEQKRSGLGCGLSIVDIPNHFYLTHFSNGHAPPFRALRLVD